MVVDIVQMIISMLLFLVLFFGISFILNMILKVTWLMAFVYPFIVVILMDGISSYEYIINPRQSLNAAWEGITGLLLPDILMLLSGFIGIIIAGYTIRYLRNSGYKMF